MSRLLGKQIVITRATHQAQPLADLLIQHGATPVFYPCIAIIPPADTTALDEALNRLAVFDWLVLTSPNTVEMLHHQQPAPRWGAIKIACVGDVTAHALHMTFGKLPNFIPSQPTAQHLGEQLPLIGGEHIFLPQSALAPPRLADSLRGRGASVTAIPAYHTVSDRGGDDVPRLLAVGKIDAITFTSSSAVTHFVGRVGYVPDDVLVVCLGAPTAHTAYAVGFKRVGIADDGRLGGLITCLEQALM